MKILERIKKNRAHGSLMKFHDLVMQHRLEIENEQRGQQLTWARILSAITSVVDSDDAIRAFEAYSEDEVHGQTDPTECVVWELAHYIGYVTQFIPSDSVLECARFFIGNNLIRGWAKKYPQDFMQELEVFAMQCNIDDKLPLLAVVEENDNILLEVVGHSDGSTVASFFCEMGKGIDSNIVNLRFRASPSFRALSENRKYLDHFQRYNPSLLKLLAEASA